MLFASIIGLWAAGIAIILYLMTQTSWLDINVSIEIQRKANLTMERLLRGFKAPSDTAPRGLLDAKSFTIDSPASIRFTSGIDNKERSFYLDNEQLMYDPDTTVGSNEQLLTDDIAALSFSASVDNPTRQVLISLSLSKQIKGVNKTMELSGAAVLRNG